MGRKGGNCKLEERSAAYLDARSCDLVAEFFAILGHPKRVAILCELRDGRRTVSQLADHCGVTLPNISQHLRTMRGKGVVRAEKEGQRVFYSIEDERFIAACKLIRDALVEHMQVRAGAFESVPAQRG